ncbi:MAG TPA: peptidylprolyl isomerase [Candidatus Baltobacteraceae bacterium]|nr:peptidylprolyl isomerase [Candidatus Baltobacteraceae bacterium]
MEGRVEPIVYLLRCSDGSLYTGWTCDLARRLAAHAAGKASKYTRSRLPVQLAAWAVMDEPSQARSLEARLKVLTRGEKLEALRAGEAFGTPLRKPPMLVHPHPTSGGLMQHTAPAGDELKTNVERAKESKARIATPHGDIVFTFYADDAPQHCAAFVKLADAGFYDGLKFHRVEPGFVVQGGDPSGNGTGGPGYQLKAEFNERPHVRGTVAMARASNPNSAGSQFYICLDDARFLDRQYTVFGQMTDGFDALDAIRVGDVMTKVTIEPKAGQ